ncbi:MAG: potassium transporter KtrB [Clostridia bacterium]|nr:potassium transporter KtrB [Clostridia bacterium]
MNKRFFNTTRIILLSFLAVILLGSLLLSLPVSTQSGEGVPYIDALFTATTATCVTGLVTVPTFSTWSIFGQVVILVLIQVGGLGVITVMTGFMLALKKRVGLSDRLLIQDAFNLNTLSGLAAFVKKVILGTFLVECGGALLYMCVFIPEYGAAGIWYGVFHSVSAFCNAGIDLLSENSLSAYACNPLVNFTTSALVILGGLGFVVWWDLLRVLKEFPKKKFRTFRFLTLHSKIALTLTAVLLFGGAAALLLLEYNNPGTMGNLSLFDKLQTAFFQSMTTRTAGFFTLPQQELTDASAVLSVVLMFIGGSPVGTAGGVKTVTLAVLLAATVSTVKNKDHTALFGRRISTDSLRKAVGVVCISFAVLLTATVALSAVTEAAFLDVLYETASAIGTVGLTRNLTSFLNTAGKLIIICSMYLGRVGHISLALAFNRKKYNENIVKEPTEDISVG